MNKDENYVFFYNRSLGNLKRTDGENVEVSDFYKKLENNPTKKSKSPIKGKMFNHENCKVSQAKSSYSLKIKTDAERFEVSDFYKKLENNPTKKSILKISSINHR